MTKKKKSPRSLDKDCPVGTRFMIIKNPDGIFWGAITLEDGPQFSATAKSSSGLIKKLYEEAKKYI